LKQNESIFYEEISLLVYKVKNIKRKGVNIKEMETSNNSRQLFINKYRPYTIDDFCANENLKTVLKTFIAIDDLNILIIGDTCSGKTTLLNAIIREYYQLEKSNTMTTNEPDNLLENNSNILYINNLKEQGIGFYRNEMKTFSQSHGSIYGKKKMIIIDDIDTINEQSQHVFRNYIDKYKHNVHFLSVCTNIQKVIESIQSRIHIIRIEPPTEKQSHQLMSKIITNEKLYLSPECQEFILKYSKHSIRTMINYMEKINIFIGHNKAKQKKISRKRSNETSVISLETCMNICADIKIYIFEDYITFLKENDLIHAIETIYSIHDYGFSVIDILELFFIFIKCTSSLKEDEKYKIIKLLCKYITIFYSVHENIIELALFTYDLYLNIVK
jgi:DNA polymerase-3 subunit gamma/tau